MAKVITINDIDYYSYADTTDAEIYNNAVYGSTWSSLEETAQKQLLVMATRKIDSYQYIGSKVEENQPLKFPRITQTGKTSDEQVLINLCCQVASYYYTNGSSDSGSSSGDILSALKEYKVGDFQVNFKDDVQLDLSGLDDFIEDALKEWMISSGMQIWL